MLISCPRCSSVYVVNKDQVPEKGKKFKCAECGKIWTVMPKDLFDVEPEKHKFKTQKVRPATEFDSDNENIRKMFEVLDRDTKGLFDKEPEQYTSNEELNRLIRHARVNISPLVVNGAIMIFILFLSAFIAYFNRYDVVRFMPRMQYFYEKFGIESVYYGRDLKIKEVATKHILKHGKHFIEAHGTIENEGKYKANVPPMRVIVSTITGQPLIRMIKNPVIPVVDPHFSYLFRVLIESLDNDTKILEIHFMSKEEYAEYEEEKRLKALKDAKGKKVLQQQNRFDLNRQKKEDLSKF